MFGITFEDREREIGLRLYEDGHVELEPPTKDGFHEACVTNFKTKFWVWVSLGGDGIEHECDCPLFEDDEIGCEHLYALLLTLGSDSGAAEHEATNEPPPLIVSYCLLGVESESAQAPVIQLMDESKRVITMHPEEWQRVEEPDDIEALSAIGRQCGGLRAAREGGGFLQHRGPHTLRGEETNATLQHILKTHRLYIRPAVGGDLRGPLHAGENATSQFHLRIRPISSSHSEMSAVLMDENGKHYAVADVDLLISGGASFFVQADTLAEIDHAGAPEILTELRSGGSKRIRTDQVEPLLAQMGAQQPLPIVLQDSVESTDKSAPGECIRCVHVDRRGDITALRLSFKYGALEIPFDSRATRPFDPSTHKQITRDTVAESKSAEIMVEAGAGPDTDLGGLFWIDTTDISEILSSLHERDFRVFLDRRPVRRATELSIEIKAEESVLSVALRIPGKAGAIPLQTLLASWRTRQDAVLLDDGTALIPADSMKEKLDRLLQIEDIALQSTATSIDLGAASALLLDALLPDEMASKGASFENLVTQLERDNFDTTPIDLTNAGVTATLRPYQETGVAFLDRLYQLSLGGCLADDMGLGKTLQVLSHLAHRRLDDPDALHLVVVPRSLLFNWSNEATNFTPDIPVHIYHGPRRSLERTAPGSVVLTTYGVLLRDQQQLSARTFDVCVFDEAQALKNPNAKTTKSAHTIRSNQKLTLTGTPLENSIDDLWSLMDITNPGLFGGKRGFHRLNMADDSARAAVRRALRPVLLRRTKQEVLPELPPIIEQTILVEMSADQQTLYSELQASIAEARATRTEGDDTNALMLEALLRLRQMACHPRLILPNSEAPSGKLHTLIAHLNELAGEGRKSLVFSQFTSFLDLVQADLDAQHIPWVRLDGKTTNRAAVVDQFQNDRSLSVFLISLKAGGTGLNLTAADCVFILDPWWNPASEAQAAARAHRIGQKNSVFVQRLISRGTVEESIIELKARKKELSDDLVQGGAGAASLNRDDLLALLTN